MWLYVCIIFILQTLITYQYVMHDCMVGVVNTQEFPVFISLCKLPLCHTGVNNLGYFRCFLMYLCWRSWGFVAWRDLTWHRLRKKISHEPPWYTNHTGMQSVLGPVTMGWDLLWFVGWEPNSCFFDRSDAPAFSSRISLAGNVGPWGRCQHCSCLGEWTLGAFKEADKDVCNVM